ADDDGAVLQSRPAFGIDDRDVRDRERRGGGHGLARGEGGCSQSKQEGEGSAAHGRFTAEGPKRFPRRRCYAAGMKNEAVVVSVNVGLPREIVVQGRTVRTAIWKHPVPSTTIRGVTCEGDQQADLSVHGGPDKAVYAYASEDQDYWRSVEDFEIGPGIFGE